MEVTFVTTLLLSGREEQVLHFTAWLFQSPLPSCDSQPTLPLGELRGASWAAPPTSVAGLWPTSANAWPVSARGRAHRSDLSVLDLFARIL